MTPRHFPFRLLRLGLAFTWLRSRTTRRRRIRTELGYGAFLSYSGDRDRQWLPHLQRTIERQSRPWYKPPRIRVFLDDSGVSIGPQLWGKIEAGLSRSEWLVVMASPEAKESAWVDREIEWWLTNRSVDSILLVVSGGQLVWDEQRGDWNPELSTALPTCLSGRFEQQPVWKTVDLRHPDDGADLLPDVDSVALGIASVVRGLPEDDLKSEGMRDTRRNLRTARITAGILGLLLLITSTVSVIALVQRAEATRQRDHAVAQQLISQSSFLATRDPFGARLKALAAWRIDPTPESRLAVLNAAVNPETGLLAHSWPVGSVAYSPDGKTIASGGGDGMVRLWDATTQRKVGAPFIGHNRGISSVAFGPGGRTLASASDDGTVRLWNVADRRQIDDAFNPHSGMINSVAFSPDGGTLVTTGDHDSGAAVRMWDVAAHRQIGKPLGDPDSFVDAVAFSPDGRTFATGDTDGVQLWDAHSRVPLGKKMRAHGISVTSVAFSGDGRTIAAADYDGSVRLWNTSTRTPAGKPFTASGWPADSVAFNPDGALIATASRDNTVRLWSVATRKQVGAPLTGHTGPIEDMAFSPDGSTLATAGGDSTVRLWNVRAQRQTGPSIDTGKLSTPAVSRNGRTLAVSGSDGAVQFWNVAARRQIGGSLDSGGTGPALAFSPDSTVLATATSYGAKAAVKLWDVRNRRQSGTLGHRGTSADRVLTFSPDGRTLATSSGGSVLLWNLATHRQTGAVPGAGSPTIAFSPDSRTIATSTADDTVALWDAATHRRIGETQPGHTADIKAVAFSPDGTLIATASRDNTVRLWSVATRKQVGEPLTGHLSGVNSVAFSPNGKVLVSGSMDHTVRLWDVATRRQIGEPLEGHSGDVNGAVFDPSGKTITSWGEDNSVRLWGVDATEDPVQSLCAWARGAFTAGRWRAYVPSGPAYRPLCPKSGAK